MFGKKPSTPKALWAVQLLTTEYLVDGNLDYDDPTGSWFLQVQAAGGVQQTATLNLTQARFQPTGDLNVTIPTAAVWTLPSTGTFVACIPRDYGHIFRLERPADLDPELIALLQEAYAIGSGAVAGRP